MRLAPRMVVPVLILLTAVTALGKVTGVHKVIDHKAEKSGELTPVSIEHGDTLDIEIQNTNTDCYFYNTKVTVAPQAGDPTALVELPPKNVQHLEVTHDESVIAYIVEITARENDECKEKESEKLLGARTYTIPVRALWNLVGAGGFVGHDLVNPEFYLEKTSNGFTVRRQAENEDDTVVSGAGMLHLYRSSRGWKGVSWAPISFGLSVDDKRNDYLLGTSARFGSRAYLTFGRIFGNVNRLPNGLSIDGTTDNANALGSLPTRRKGAWFVSASFGFLSAGVSNLFKNKVGVPQASGATATATGGTGTGTAAKPVSITPAPSSGLPGDSVALAAPGDGALFGEPAENSRLEFRDFKDKLTDISSRNLGKAWTDKKITFSILDKAAPGEAAIDVIVAGKKVAAAKFSVGSSITAKPEHGANSEKIELVQVADMDFGNGAESVIVLKQGELERTLASNADGVSWKADKITFTPGAFAQTGEVLITVKVGGTTRARSKYKVD